MIDKELMETKGQSLISNLVTSGRYSPWRLTAVLLTILLLLIGLGAWRSTGTGAQVQVPMFYDAHYLFPRPWTQAQAAPGVPDPAPLAFYGPNVIRQPFVSGADRLSMVEIWLAGPEETAVSVSLRDEAGLVYGGEIILTQGETGGVYRLTFPNIPEAEGRTFWLALAAPEAAYEAPVIAHTVGGDWLGGALHLNEYGRPGNLALQTYARGLPGGWWLDTLGEQLLPDLFRLRLQQYKPVKGPVFPLLLGAMVVLTGAFLLLARPATHSLRRVSGWGAAGLLLAFLVWQLGSGRLRLPLLTPTIPLAETSEPLQIQPLADDFRLLNDLSAALWTAERRPEERFVETVIDDYPAIRVPAISTLRYDVVAPPNGRLRLGVQTETAGQLRATALFNETVLASEVVGEEPVWLDLDLSPLAGQAGRLSLMTVTEPIGEGPHALWLQPQLLAQTDWLATTLPDEARPLGYRLGEAVELAGFELQEQSENEQLVTLYWRAERPLTQHATVFVHLLNEAGEIVAQHDAQPVSNAYLLPNWIPGVLIADSHRLVLPDDLPAGRYELVAGLYDPQDLTRWPVLAPDGMPAPDNRVFLTPFVVEAGASR